MTYYTDDANKVEYDMDEAIKEIVTKVAEDKENFIFETIAPFLKEKTKLTFNKQLLVDALTEFRERHPERFEEEQEDGSNSQY